MSKTSVRSTHQLDGFTIRLIISFDVVALVATLKRFVERTGQRHAFLELVIGQVRLTLSVLSPLPGLPTGTGAIEAGRKPAPGCPATEPTSTLVGKLSLCFG